jgi:choline-sulfatase
MKSHRWIALSLLLLFSRPEAAHTRIRADRFLGPKPPNILIIVGDDHGGGTLGIDGDPRRATPRLDDLARQGVRFDRAYCNSPLCTPSRQSFISGRLPHAVGVTLLGTPLPERVVTLGSWLSDLGYHTAAFGKMHFNDGDAHGFDERLDSHDWRANLKRHPPKGGDHRRPWRPFVDPAATWLNAERASAGLPDASMESTFYAQEAASFFKRQRERRDPFALVVGFYDPHSPFRFPDDWARRYHPWDFPEPIPLTDFDRRDRPAVFSKLTPEEIRGVEAAYYTSLSFMDANVGRILDALDRSGMANDTIVVYLGDNGYMRGSHGRFEKHCFYEQAIRVPLILRWPKHLPADRRTSAMVELVDLFPTLMDLSGLPQPPNTHGKSLAPLMRDEPGAAGREIVFSEYLENEEAMIRSDRFKLIVGNGRVKRNDGYATGRPPSGPYERLYDLQADPNETTDVASRPELAAIRETLRHHLYEKLVGTRDPLSQAPVGLSERDAIHWCLVPRDAKSR